MKETTNYKLKKIELTDSPPDITVHSGNFDIIDTEMKRIDDEATNVGTGLADLRQEVNEHKAEDATQDKPGHIKLSDIPVKSVNGKTGEVMIDVDDIASLYRKIRIGEGSSAGQTSSISIGRHSTAANVGAVAIGNYAKTNGSNAVCIGSNALGSASGGVIAIGANADAEGPSSIAIGADVVSRNTRDIVLGISTQNCKIPGGLDVAGTKNFEIPHPKPEKNATHVIRHGAVESPTPGDTLYRWKIAATKDNDIVTIDLPDYFIWLNKNVQIFVTGQGHFGNGYGVLNRETEQLEIHCQYEGEYNVLVIGTRNDGHQSVQDWNIKGVEREIGESWTGETYAFSVDEIMEVEEIKEEVV